MMKKTLLCSLLLASLGSTVVHADAASSTSSNNSTNGKWTGSGELGYSAASGNTHSQNGDAKLNIAFNNEYWRNAAYVTALRTRSDSNGSLYTSAERYEAGVSIGYKLDLRSYIVNSVRYEHDDFGSNLWDAVYAIGYGYTAIKNQNNELSFEAGPGYKRYAETEATDSSTGRVVSTYPVKGEGIARGLLDYKRRLSDNASAEETFLVEAGSDNQYYKNDLGLTVSITKKFALKLAYEVRYNSNVAANDETVHTDRLFTTNMSYSF